MFFLDVLLGWLTGSSQNRGYYMPENTGAEAVKKMCLIFPALGAEFETKIIHF